MKTPRPKRILLVTLHAQLIGGLEVYVRDVALSLRRQGHKVSVLSVLEPTQEYQGWEDIPIASLAPSNPFLLRLYFRSWHLFLTLVLFRVKGNYDNVWIMHPYAAIAAYKAAVTNYDVWTHGVEVWGRWPAWLRTGLQNARRIVSVSKFTQNAVKHHLLGKDVVIIRPVVNVDRFVPPNPPRSPKLPFRLLTVGRLELDEINKGHDTVIQNLRAISNRVNAPIEYRIVGDGNDRKRMEKVARDFGVATGVVFEGRVSDEQLVRAYQGCDIFVMPSAREGFGIVYIEASACGKPIIGSTFGGAMDAIEDGVTGFCVDPNSDEELIDRISYLLLHPDIALQMGQAGRTRVEKEFSARTLDKSLSILLKET